MTHIRKQRQVVYNIAIGQNVYLYDSIKILLPGNL